MQDVHGNLSHAMRDNYNEYGVEEYYRKVATTYRNPFFPSVKQEVVWTIMTKWVQAEGFARQARVLDMAAGSGEVTQALLEWERARRQSKDAPVRTPVNSRAYIPPNARRPVSATPLPEGFGLSIVATDPFTASAYTERTQRPCHALSFADLAEGQCPPEEPGHTSDSTTWDIVICSFALHLVPSASELFALLHELSLKATWLIIIAPHKKPEIKDGWGWIRWDLAAWTATNCFDDGQTGEQSSRVELVHEKTRLRLYRSVQT